MIASTIDDAERRNLNPERMVSVKDALRYGRWSKVTLYKLVRNGKIDAYKDGRWSRIDLDSVDRYKRALPKVKAREFPKAS